MILNAWEKYNATLKTDYNVKVYNVFSKQKEKILFKMFSNKQYDNIHLLNLK